MSGTARLAIGAIQEGVTWHTALAVGALDAIPIKVMDEIALQGDITKDIIVGCSEVENFDHLLHVADPTLTFDLRYSGRDLAFIGSLFGAEAISGAGPYLHQFDWQVEAAKFHTLALGMNGSAYPDILEIPSLKPTGVTLQSNDEGLVEFTVRNMGDTIKVAGDAVNVTGDLQAATFITKSLRIPARDFKIRIDTVAGGTLAEINWESFALTLDRPYDRELLTNAAVARKQTFEPVQNNVSEGTLSLTVPDYNTVALFDDLNDQTPYFVDMVATETVGATTYIFTVELPRLIPMPYNSTLTAGERQSLTRNFQIAQATSNPGSMGHSNWCRIEVTDAQSAQYVS